MAGKHGAVVLPKDGAPGVLIAHDLSPAETAGLTKERVLAIVTEVGTRTSHTAILARALEIPAVVGVPNLLTRVGTGDLIVVDGVHGQVGITPSEALIADTAARAGRFSDVARHRREARDRPIRTRCGQSVELRANIELPSEAEGALEQGARGIGLYRTEFLYLDRSEPPSEDEQFEAYKAIAEAIGKEHPLVIRTLDVGGDKPLAYLPFPKEDNPFLGERGVRVALDRPEILRGQLRAILRASAFGRVSVMFPMISSLEEIRDAKAILAEESKRLGIAPIPAGIMVEVPVTAVMAAQFANEADFFSIGTNDLTQYTLAMDRGHPKLAPRIDGLNPGVLHLINHTVRGGHAANRPVAVCGGIASDVHGVPILIGLDVDELSISLPAIPAIKGQIRKLRFDECRELAQKALAAESAADVRALIGEPNES